MKPFRLSKNHERLDIFINSNDNRNLNNQENGEEMDVWYPGTLLNIIIILNNNLWTLIMWTNNVLKIIFVIYFLCFKINVVIYMFILFDLILIILFELFVDK